MSFSFLLGILACCISAFVTVNRFGFALEGSWCAIDRFYYDSFKGQLKETKPRWEGLETTKQILENIGIFSKILKDNLNNDWFNKSITVKYYPLDNTEKTTNKTILELLISIDQLISSYDSLTKNSSKINITSFKKIETDFLKDFEYYAKTLRACLKILAMIYYCLLLIAITAAGVSMMFYACLKRQGYLITFMHVLWNVIRFFMFSFFLYGTAYGIGFLAIRDSIAVIKKLFGDNLSQNELVGGKEFLEYCLKESGTNMLGENDIRAIKTFFLNIGKFMEEEAKLESSSSKPFTTFYVTICSGVNKTICDFLNKTVLNNGLDKSFDCGFLKSDLNQLYRALSDASVESRILAALSLCSSFFGAVAVYFFLLVMHHYNNELFFDSGKSIFTGFDGFGGGYKKKMHDKDPAYKKRKLRAEIELTSKNDEQSAYKNVNKNEDED